MKTVIAGQLGLFTGEVIEDERETDIGKRFDKFHARNPIVYQKLVEMALLLKRQKWDKIGIKMLFEVLRWNYMMQTTDPSSDYKLCNDYHSRYARLIMKNEPELAGMFELRELRS